MPHLSSILPFVGHAEDGRLQEVAPENQDGRQSHLRSSLLKRPFDVFKRHRATSSDACQRYPTAPAVPTHDHELPVSLRRRPSCPENLPRRAIPSLPRPQTFRRQESERRERLLEVPPTPTERRTMSTDRRRSRGFSLSALHRQRSPRPTQPPSLSAPCFGQSPPCTPVPTKQSDSSQNSAATPSRNPRDLPPLEIPQDQPDLDSEFDPELRQARAALEEEFEQRWILNLSMQFRDRSNREKFFVTYAEWPNKWRRLTISIDYRDAIPDSLEEYLSTLHFQRDKSLRIYEAIRDSLSEIQYYNTVTNLKLQTTRNDNQLHVHVREDANEIINFPSISFFDHVRCPCYHEKSLEFDTHLSGFVYKVRLGDRIVIKKEIPGPDTVDEFLYEVNALDALMDSPNVIRLEGLVTDDHGSVVKGLLISYASKGALVDLLYDYRDSLELPWHRREKWAKQIVNGLAEIHEAGFVQGDFTLSNIVIDANDNAQIIDVNRRGCPVGWEPPELGRLIESGQRIGMCISVKTDLYQLGMVLWALAQNIDEPEREARPLPELPHQIPAYFRGLVATCLSERPQGRASAKELLRAFPTVTEQPRVSDRPPVDFLPPQTVHHTLSQSHRSDKEYIDPKLAITIDDVKDRRRSAIEPDQMAESQVTYVEPDSNPASTTDRIEGSGSWCVGRRGRTGRGRSPVSSRRRPSSPFGRSVSSATSFSDQSPRRQSERRHLCGADESQPAGREPDNCTEVVAQPETRSCEGTTEMEKPHVPSSALDKRVAALYLQGQGAGFHLNHVDSGYGEMDDMVMDCPDCRNRSSDSASRANHTQAAASAGAATDGIHEPYASKRTLSWTEDQTLETGTSLEHTKYPDEDV